MLVYIEGDHPLPVVGQLPAAQIVTDLRHETCRAVVIVVNDQTAGAPGNMHSADQRPHPQVADHRIPNTMRNCCWSINDGLHRLLGASVVTRMDPDSSRATASASALSVFPRLNLW